MDYANKLIYQVFVRNHTKEGTLKALIPDLKRIRSLGTDILYLMPLQPIGQKGRKGKLGSPYAISDYCEINPELGTWDDFRSVAEVAHQLGMKVIVDQVFNHISRDAKLLNEHPEYYWHDQNNHFGNKVGDWSDVYDLDYRNPGLTDYLLNVLDLFLAAGADGFRFDVASLIPVSFFASLKAHLSNVWKEKEVILLAEAIEASFALETRSHGYNALANAELSFNGFSLFYSYFSFPWLREYLAKHNRDDLVSYRVACLLEESALPSSNSWITRALENHDQRRLASYGCSNPLHHNLLAYSFFTKGPAFLYAGEEYGVSHQPSLFDEDKIEWKQEKGEEVFEYVSRLITLKKREENLMLRTSLFLDTGSEVFVVENRFKDYSEWGIFNFSSKPLPFPHQVISDGLYLDLLSEKEINVDSKKETMVVEPLWLRKKQ